MKVNIPQKNQTKIIVTILIVAILIVLLLVLGERLFIIDNRITDNERFYTEYTSVSIDNVYKYVSIEQAIKLFDEEKAIIFFGFKECKWCQSYVPILNDVAKANKVEQVYYCNIKEDRANNTEKYKTLVNIITDYLYDDDNGNKRIYVPDVYFVKGGNIIGHNNDTSMIEGADTEEYYTNDARKNLEQKLDKLTKEVYSDSNACSDDKRGC